MHEIETGLHSVMGDLIENLFLKPVFKLLESNWTNGQFSQINFKFGFNDEYLKEFFDCGGNFITQIQYTNLVNVYNRWKPRLEHVFFHSIK